MGCSALSPSFGCAVTCRICHQDVVGRSSARAIDCSFRERSAFGFRWRNCYAPIHESKLSSDYKVMRPLAIASAMVPKWHCSENSPDVIRVQSSAGLAELTVMPGSSVKSAMRSPVFAKKEYVELLMR